MGGREVCVCYFVEILRQGQPKISRHLAYLRKAGIVAARREGKWMHYRMVPQADEAAASILDRRAGIAGQRQADAGRPGQAGARLLRTAEAGDAGGCAAAGACCLEPFSDR